MKTTATLTAAAVALLGSAAVASADDHGELSKLEIGGFVGAHLFNDDNELGVDDDPDADSPTNAVAFGIRAGYNFLPFLAAEGELAVMPTSMRQTETPLTVFGWRAHAIGYLLPQSSRVRPFALAGVGFLTSSPRDQNDVTTDTDFLFHFGLGAKVRVQKTWGIRADVRLLLPPSSANESVTADWEFLVGLYKNFGKDKKPAAPGDSDGDGVTDDVDKCPDKPEDADGFEDEDGCPDDDNDGDGIADGADQCPDQAEDKNGVDDGDGCPESDADGDGIVGSADRCPDQPEDADGHDDADGCPDPDNDGDGIEDGADQCPDQAETVNNFEDADGCPDTVPTQVSKFTGTIEGITFALGSSNIRASSNPTLDEAAEVLKKHTTIRLEIGGHTDNTGTRDWNLKLSQMRADAVKKYLVGKGIAEARLVAKGYGPDKPIDDNNTAAGRAKNRRVEFTLISQ